MHILIRGIKYPATVSTVLEHWEDRNEISVVADTAQSTVEVQLGYSSDEEIRVGSDQFIKDPESNGKGFTLPKGRYSIRATVGRPQSLIDSCTDSVLICLLRVAEMEKHFKWRQDIFGTTDLSTCLAKARKKWREDGDSTYLDILGEYSDITHDIEVFSLENSTNRLLALEESEHNTIEVLQFGEGPFDQSGPRYLSANLYVDSLGGSSRRLISQYTGGLRFYVPNMKLFYGPKGFIVKSS